MHVFVSYSHKDRRWLDRLQVHLAPLTHSLEIDLWDDTKLRPGSKWRQEIRSAVDCADVAILIISADFLASDFIRTNELPPLLRSAQEEGTLIVPIIASPSLFLRNNELSQFQAVNAPSIPLISASEAEQEAIFVRVAELLLDQANEARTKQGSADRHAEQEAFLDHDTWSRLVKIGSWIFDERQQVILGGGPGSYLLSREEYGDREFGIIADISFTNFQMPSKSSLGMNAGIIFGWKSEGGVHRYYNVLITGAEILVERVGFNGGSDGQDFQHITDSQALRIVPEHPYRFEVNIGASEITIEVDEKRLISLKRPTGVVGRVGLRPWRSKLDCTKFVVSARPSQRSKRR